MVMKGWISRLFVNNGGMRCVVKTTNLARLNFLQALLADGNVPFVVFDEHISALEAGIGAFPRRLMVDEERRLAAKTILADAGELYDD